MDDREIDNLLKNLRSEPDDIPSGSEAECSISGDERDEVNRDVEELIQDIASAEDDHDMEIVLEDIDPYLQLDNIDMSLFQDNEQIEQSCVHQMHETSRSANSPINAFYQDLHQPSTSSFVRNVGDEEAIVIVVPPDTVVESQVAISTNNDVASNNNVAKNKRKNRNNKNKNKPAKKTTTMKTGKKGKNVQKRRE